MSAAMVTFIAATTGRCAVPEFVGFFFGIVKTTVSFVDDMDQFILGKLL